VRALAFAAGAFLAPAVALAAAFAGVEVPPPPAPRPVFDTHWGVKVEDPYRFLENTADPEVQKLMRAQADAAQAILDRIPGRDKLLARLREIDDATPAVVGAVQRDDKGTLYYLKRDAKANQLKLYTRAASGGEETLLVDPEAESKAAGKPHAINGFTVSPDGRRVAFVMAVGGAEIGALRVIDTKTREEVQPRTDRVRGGQVGWLPDSSGFFYGRLAEGYEKRPRAERFMDVMSYLRRLDAPAADKAVFGPGLHPEVDIDRTSSGALFATRGAGLVAALVYHGVDRNRSLFVAERAGVLEGKPRWRKVFDRADQVNAVAIGGGWLYAKTAKDAPRFKVVRLALPEADPARAATVIPAGEEVIAEIAAAKEGLYVTTRRGPAKTLARFAHEAGAKAQAVPMPFEGNIDIVDADGDMPGLVLTLGGWTRAAKHYLLAGAGASATPLALAPAGRYDEPAGIVSREVVVKSHDGVEVPVSIISRADIRLDGRAPAMLYGYGAYGIVEEPGWSPRLLAWLERGGVFAIAHVRGGGIFGDAWHRAGWKTTKHNTWKDGIAAAEWLVAQGYTAKDRLSIYGGSAGGIFVGRAITERPDLFASAVVGVGNTDSLRSETRANGAGNIPEYGTFTKEDEFRGLAAMSPYANVKAGTAYPAVLFEHGVNDIRVDVWMTLKTGSRLAAATSSGKPVLMRLEYDAGHGPGATRDQAQRRTADRWAFMLWQAGAEGFQPAP
jgi:prolyl oligopeptidase